MPRFELIGLTTVPEISPGDDLASCLADALTREIGPLAPTDVLVVAQKIVSKAEGCLVRLDEVVPSPLAETWARAHDRDPRVVEVVFRESRRIVRMDRGVLVVETHHGFVCANAGVDTSNVPQGCALTLPRDPDASARGLRRGIADHLDVAPGVIVCDTFGRPWREGLTNIAIGLAGVRAFEDHRGRTDVFGRRLQVTRLAVADELASAAELVMGKTRGVPAALVRGLDVRGEDNDARGLLRRADSDLFR